MHPLILPLNGRNLKAIKEFIYVVQFNWFQPPDERPVIVKI